MTNKNTNNNNISDDGLNWEEDDKTFSMSDSEDDSITFESQSDLPNADKNKFWNIFPHFFKSLKGFNIHVLVETKERRIAVSLTAAIPVILLVMHFSTPKKQPQPHIDKVYYQVKITQPKDKNYLEFALKSFDHKTEQFSTENISEEDFKDIIKNIRYTQASTPLYYEGNKIFPCAKDTGTLYFVFEPIDTAIHFEISSDGVPFHLNGKTHNTLAACAKSLETGDIIAKGINPCKLEVQLPEKYLNEPYRVSITGRQGPYKHQLIWDIPDKIERFDVWVYFENMDTSTYSPVASINNETRITRAGCTGCDAKAQQLLTSEFITLANSFGNNPSDRNTLRAFRNYCDSKFETLRIKVNGVTQPYWSDMEALLKTSYFNDKKRYKIKGISLINNCSGIFFEFNEINQS